jgi:hypothetical protein
MAFVKRIQNGGLSVSFSIGEKREKCCGWGTRVVLVLVKNSPVKMEV